MKKWLYTALSLSLLAPSMATFADAYTKPIPKKDVIIVFKKKVDSKLIQKSGGVIEDKYKNIPAVSANLPVRSIEKLEDNPSIDYVEIDQKVNPIAQRVDWGIVNTKSDLSQKNGFTGKGVKVAVLDTGVKINHSDLLLSGGYNPNGSTYDDMHGHGTHVAGIIGAKNNDYGVVGVAPDANVYGVKVLNNSDGSGSTSDIIKGIDWAISNDMDIINMSLGSNTYSQAFQDAVTRAHNAGIFVVAAAGNDGNVTGTGDTVDYPAKYENVIAIAATNDQNAKAGFSSAGPGVDFAAPGYQILSTYKNGDYVLMSGTSMASPYFSGVLALYKEAYPSYSNEQIVTLMETSALDLGTQGKDPLFGYGLVQAPIVGDSSIPKVSIPSAPINFQASEVTGNTISLSWDGDADSKLYDVKKNGMLVYSGTLENFTDKGLLANTLYNYELRAKNIAGTSPSANLSVKTKSITLTTPTLSFVKVSNGYNINWTKASYATNYILYRDGKIIYKGNLTSYFEENVNITPGTSYSYMVIAENSTQTSRNGLKTLTIAPDSVTGLTETHTASSFTAIWNPSKGASFYQVKVNGKVVYKGLATKFTYNGLLSNTSYTVSVESGNIGGVSTPSTVSFITPQTLPKAPLTLVAKGTTNSVTLTYSGVYNAKYYNIYRNGVLIAQTASLAYADSGLNPGTGYAYSVTAANELGESQVKSVNFTTIPNAPTALNGIPSQNKVALSWNSVPGATYYVVKQNGVIVYRGAATSFTKTMLTNSTNYTYTVQAGNVTGMNPGYISVSTRTLDPIQSVMSIEGGTSYTGGQTITQTVSLKDASGNPAANENVSLKLTYPNGAYKIYNYKTDLYGNIRILIYTNIYTMKGVYKIDATKTYVKTGIYSASNASKSFTLN